MNDPFRVEKSIPLEVGYCIRLNRYAAAGLVLNLRAGRAKENPQTQEGMDGAGADGPIQVHKPRAAVVFSWSLIFVQSVHSVDDFQFDQSAPGPPVGARRRPLGLGTSPVAGGGVSLMVPAGGGGGTVGRSPDEQPSSRAILTRNRRTCGLALAWIWSRIDQAFGKNGDGWERGWLAIRRMTKKKNRCRVWEDSQAPAGC